MATDFGSRFAKKSTRDPKSVHNFDVSISRIAIFLLGLELAAELAAEELSRHAMAGMVRCISAISVGYKG